MAPSATVTPARLATAVRRRPRLRLALGTLAVILGLGGMVLGGLLFTGAHNTHPVEVDGTIADYQAITINGSYARNDLRLAGDSHTYTFDSRQFHPSLPERFQKDTRIQLWVDQGTNNVVALTLYDEMGINPTAYTTSAYDNPTLAYYGTLGEAGVLVAIGFVLLLGGGVAALGPGKRRSSERSSERSGERGHGRAASQHTPRGTMPAPAGAGQRVPAVALPSPAAALDRPGSSAQALPQGGPYGPPGTNPNRPPNAAPGGMPGGMPGAIPTAQAVPTTPMPGRQPAPPRPALPAASIDQIPTQKAPAVAPPVTPGTPPLAPTQPGNPEMNGGAAPWGAWGVPAQPVPPSPPGTLPDFPTERMPSAAPTPPSAGNPPGDVGDQPTRKSETASPPDPSRGG